MSSNKSKNYNTLIDFAKFLRQNGDKLFEKDARLCLNSEKLLILQEYFQQLLPNVSPTSSGNSDLNNKRRPSTLNNNANKEFLLLYKSNQLHIIQDFLFKITNLKITSEVNLNPTKDFINLNIFGSLTYLEIKNIPINNLYDLQNLRNQLETLICVKSLNKIQVIDGITKALNQNENLLYFFNINTKDLLHLCGADQSSPISWPKLQTLVLSHNQLTSLDNSFRLAPLIEVLDLSHNSLKQCGQFLQSLSKLKKLNLSFNRLESIPDVSQSANSSQLEYLDISYNNVETIDTESITKMVQLKHLNLQCNLFSDVMQLNRLRIMTSISEIKIEGNPVSLNPKAELILHEILTVVQIKNNLKQKKPAVTQSPMLSSTSQSLQQQRMVKRSSSHVNIAAANVVPKLLVTSDGSSRPLASSVNEKGFSVPSQSQLRASASSAIYNQQQRQRKSTRLRPNNVLIEQDDERGTETDESVDERRRSRDVVAVGNPSTSFDSRKLQNEIETLNKMRLNYGTDWLLSSSNLIEAKNSPSVSPSASKTQQDQPEPEAHKETTTATTSLDDKNIEAERTGAIVESFPVYRSIEFSVLDLKSKPLQTATSEPDDETKTICLLAISERCLIEKDETNSSVLCINDLANLSQIDLSLDSMNHHKVTIKFKDNVFARIYEFENEAEFNSFIECMKKTLLSESNLSSCEVYYCHWCKEFGRKKSTLDGGEEHQDEQTEDESNTSVISASDLSCSKCGRFLVRKGKVVDEASAGFTLKEVLTSFKPIPTATATADNNNAMSILSSSLTNSVLSSEAEDEAVNSNEAGSLASTSSKGDHKLKSLLSNTQISKSKLDEMTTESKRINNNLKLFFIINVLSATDSKSSKQDTGTGNGPTIEEDEERLLRSFRVKCVIPFSGDSKDSKQSPTGIDNCLCLFTNKSIFVFKIVKPELFDANVDFDKCLLKVHVIEVNQIEIIELSLVANYLILEVVRNDQQRSFFKLVTSDVYQTQTILNSLSKIINESKTLTMLKKIRKTNETTSKNLESTLKSLDANIRCDLDLTVFVVYTFVENYQINGSDKLDDLKFDKRSFELIVYENESLIIVEENLSYFQAATVTNNNQQFNLISSAKIGDIVNLRLFNEVENKIEISFVDESKNSKEVTWSFVMNKPYLLGKFISHVKLVWEKVFFVELPINFI